MSRYLYALGTLTIAVVLAVVIVPDGSSSSTVGATAARLAASGITFSSPSAAVPAGAISATTASTTASGSLGAAVLGEQYQHCVDTDAKINQDCYAITLDPSNVQFPGQGAGPMQPLSWLVVMIDPRTGQIIEGRGGTD